MQRIAILGLTLALGTAAALAQGRAGDFPSQPLRLIIGFPPGSAADITARLVGSVMSDRLGQQVVVESRPGAGSGIAAEFVARAPADGYTLYIGTSSNVTNAAINPNPRFDFAKDLAPVTPLTIRSPANSPTPRLGPAPCRISPRNSLACERRSSSSMCPIRGAPRRSPISWPDAFR